MNYINLLSHNEVLWHFQINFFVKVVNEAVAPCSAYQHHLLGPILIRGRVIRRVAVLPEFTTNRRIC